MTTTIKATPLYELYEGTGAGRGCYAVIRNADGAITRWNTGVEGIEWSFAMRRLSDADFNEACAQLEFDITPSSNDVITTINNSQRVFLLTGDYNTDILCNIQDFEKCYSSFDDSNSIKIQHKLNGRFVRCSKKSVIDMLKAFNLNYKFL